MADERGKGVDPTWPDLPDGEHPVTELSTHVQGALSPFGEVEFPLPQVPTSTRTRSSTADPLGSPFPHRRDPAGGRSRSPLRMPKALVDTGSGPWVVRSLVVLEACDPRLVVIGASAAAGGGAGPGGRPWWSRTRTTGKGWGRACAPG